jgi:hypothetical protein
MLWILKLIEICSGYDAEFVPVEGDTPSLLFIRSVPVEDDFEAQIRAIIPEEMKITFAVDVKPSTVIMLKHLCHEYGVVDGSELKGHDHQVLLDLKRAITPIDESSQEETEEQFFQKAIGIINTDAYIESFYIRIELESKSMGIQYHKSENQDVAKESPAVSKENPAVSNERPCISKDDILNLKIDLENITTIDDLLERM